jgi:NAD(P)-dependent dehydrogenase (short-subunit alcohol dehydrogenase family)
MTLELGGRKIVVTGEKRELARANAEPVSNEGADVVIWIRD